MSHALNSSDVAAFGTVLSAVLIFTSSMVTWHTGAKQKEQETRRLMQEAEKLVQREAVKEERAEEQRDIDNLRRDNDDLRAERAALKADSRDLKALLDARDLALAELGTCWVDVLARERRRFKTLTGA